MEWDSARKCFLSVFLRLLVFVAFQFVVNDSAAKFHEGTSSFSLPLGFRFSGDDVALTSRDVMTSAWLLSLWSVCVWTRPVGISRNQRCFECQLNRRLIQTCNYWCVKITHKLHHLKFNAVTSTYGIVRTCTASCARFLTSMPTVLMISHTFAVDLPLNSRRCYNIEASERVCHSRMCDAFCLPCRKRDIARKAH